MLEIAIVTPVNKLIDRQKDQNLCCLYYNYNHWIILIELLVFKKKKTWKPQHGFDFGVGTLYTTRLFRL